MSEETGIAVIVKLTDGSTVEVDDVTTLDWSSHPFLALRTATAGTSLFQMGEVRSVTPRPPDPEDSAVLPVESLPWKPGRWCVTSRTGEVLSKHDDEGEARARRSWVSNYGLAREETATLARLVPVE